MIIRRLKTHSLNTLPEFGAKVGVAPQGPCHITAVYQSASLVLSNTGRIEDVQQVLGQNKANKVRIKGVMVMEQESALTCGMANFTIRLEELIGNKSLRSFAQSIGASEGGVRKWFTQGTMPSFDKMVRIARQYKVNLEWLLWD